MEYDVSDELYHYGIKGQKWGVRRYENADGTLTEAGKRRYYKNGVDESGGFTRKGKKYAYRKLNSNINRSALRYDDEYDRTDEGRVKLKRYRDAIRRMENTRNWTEKDDRDFIRIENDYVTAQTTYSAKKLLKEYGNHNMSRVLHGYSRKIPPNLTDDDIIRIYVESNKYNHTY